jgi:hypothetical protein
MTLHVHNALVQGSDDWFAARRGMVTASTVGQLLTLDPPDATAVDCPNCHAEVNAPCISAARKTPTPIKTFHSERTTFAASLPPVIGTARNDQSQRLTLLLASERITGITDDRENFTSNDMLIGQLDEPLARDVYSGHYAEAVECGFMVEDRWGFSIGYSPDGLVGDDGLIEVKSPRAKEHLRTILADEVPARYMPQLQTGLLVSGRDWIDYVSFFGGMPLYVKRVLPDPRWAEAIVAAVTAFEQTVAEMARAYAVATQGLPATEPRIDFSDIKVA